MKNENVDIDPPKWGGKGGGMQPLPPADRSQGWDDLASEITHVPDSYPATTEIAVRFVPVVRNGETLGYLWAAVDGSAGKYVRRKAAGVDGWNASVPWVQRLREAKAEGLTAVEALRRWVGAPEDPRAGAIPADAVERELPTLQALRELAAEDR